MDDPAISVLLPAYNAEKYAKQAVQSILHQTFTNIELLVADDGSTDCTRSVIDTFQDDRIRTFHRDSNVGKNEICNMLLEQARGRFISVHDADDFSHPSRFDFLLRFLSNETEYAMCGSSYYTVSESGRDILEKNRMPTSSSSIQRDIQSQSQFHGPTLLIRREIIQEVGGLYRYFVFGEDIDFTMRVVEKYKTSNLPYFLYYYRICPNSITKSVTNFSFERAVTNELRYFLADQRKLRGYDCLMVGEPKELEAEKRRLISNLDKLQVVERSVGYLLHYGMYQQALLFCITSFPSNVKITGLVRILMFSFRKALIFLLRRAGGFIKYEQVDFSSDTRI